MEAQGVLHSKKYTEYSRVILAMTALGYDVTDIGGYNLLEPLAEYSKTVYQGINSAAFALIAFNSANYEIPTASDASNQTTEAKLIDYLLEAQLGDGGWNYSSSATAGDPDMTAMVIQSLAPYYQESGYEKVTTAVDAALSCLSKMQLSDGGFSSSGTENVESTAQVLVALTALGIDPLTD